MKLPSPTEKDVLNIVSLEWTGSISGKKLLSGYSRKHGPPPKGTFYTLLRRLVSKGWIGSRKGNPKKQEDGRVRYYFMSQKGKELHDVLTSLQEAMKHTK